MKPGMIILVLAILLGILHQDWWLWDSDSVWLGFLPAGLGYHALYSLMAATLWFFACRFAWPAELEEEETSK